MKGKIYIGKTLGSFLLVLFTMPLGHALMMLMEHFMQPTLLHYTAFFMGFVGLVVTVVGIFVKGDTRQTIYGLAGGLLFWTGWVEFLLAYYAQRYGTHCDLVGTGTGSYDSNGDFQLVSKDEYEEIRAWIKKGVVGCSADTDNLATNQNSCLANPLLRVADVMLHYCEACIAGGTSTTDPLAITVFNRIRARAGLAPVSEITTASLWDERRCELALEGVAWPDFVRRAYYDEAAVLDFMGKQNRNAGFTYKYDTNTFSWKTKDDGSIEKVGSKDEETPTANRLLLPYPESELIKNQLLKAAPVPYNFND